MGTWPGHALPGGFFIVFAIWWMIQFTYEKVALDNGRLKPGTRILRVLHRLPIEGITIMCAGIIGFIAEMMYPIPKWTLIGSDGQFKHPAEWQHCTMYTFFSMYGLVTILSKTCMPHAEKYTKVFGALAFFIEGMLFHFHTHGRPGLDVHLHNLLVIAIGFCVLLSVCEIWHPKDERIRIMRYTSTLLQGTWFFQVGTILYWPPSGEPWDEEDHINMMFITVAFAWHLLFDIIIMVIVYGVVGMILRMTGTMGVRYRPMKNGLEEIEFDDRTLLKNGEPSRCGSDIDSD
ncbi:transmembrane protein 45B-like [Asterias rubens]|uniref:transmembrane protein 45B-like n=1 Tax=Asterias rubens TaxID=7604 RepID=UPI001455C517|nr:transmembrane protein 45B-like [Asterias rubens]